MGKTHVMTSHTVQSTATEPSENRTSSILRRFCRRLADGIFR